MLKKCYINSDLILDFNSLLFSILKKQNPELNLSIQIKKKIDVSEV